MYFLGIDVHWKSSNIHILSDTGQPVKALTTRGGWIGLVESVRQIGREAPGGICICYEASCGYGYLYDQFKKEARHIAVAHPGKLAGIYGKKKHNKLDAEHLAKLLYLDMVPQVHVPAQKVRHWRKLIEYRQRILDKQTRCKNQIRAMLKECGIQCPYKGQGLWTVKGLRWLEALELPGESYGLIRGMAVEELQALRARLKEATRVLDKMGRDHAGVRLLRTIPGIGPRTAEAVVAYVDQVGRFGRIKQIGSYVGLVPCEHSTGDSRRLGHITRQGPATVRKLLVEAAWQAIRRSPTVKAYFQRIAGEKQDRRKIALVAVAHYLSRVMLAMLRSGESWRESVQVNTES